jgi:hypothetical protein
MVNHSGGRSVLKRFVLAFLAFIALIVPAALLLALLAAPARPQPVERNGCEQNVADSMASVAAMQARVKSINAARGPEICNATRLYFLEVVKARAVIALCKTGPDRERELGRFDADVEHINEAISARCS